MRGGYKRSSFLDPAGYSSSDCIIAKFEMFAVYVMLFLAVGGGVGGQAAQAQPMETPRTLCGPKLADAHSLYCFSTEKVLKRSMIGNLYGYAPAEARAIMSRAQSALALTARNKRLPGLVDECCYKPCYVSELLTYC